VKTGAAIKTALERNARAVSLRPSVGQGTAVTRVRLRDGLTCDITEGQWSLVAGMTEKYGGDGSGPNPGVFGRAAVGSCLAIGYAMWFARLDVPLSGLEVEIQADYDVRGELGVSTDVRPGYQQIRYVVTVTSDAPAEEVMRVLDTADRCSSWLDNMAHPVPMVREVRLTAAAG
jgi:uncharacterized OsmC-like protein